MIDRSWWWPLPFACFVGSYLLMSLLFRVRQVSVPSLVGKDLRTALLHISDANLNARLVGEKEESELPAGTVIRQTPGRGQPVRPHQSIFLVTSRQPPPLIMPDLVGKQSEQVVRVIKEQGVKTKTFHVPSVYPSDTCIGQIPCPLAHVGRKSSFCYIAIPTTKPIIWPTFLGRPLEEVLSFLETHQIPAQVTHHGTTRTIHAQGDYTVVDQRPLAGSLITLEQERPPLVQLEVARVPAS